MPRFTMTIKQTMNFLNEMSTGIYKTASLQATEMSLFNSLANNIYVQNLAQIYTIQDATEMRRLIRGRGRPRPGSYNHFYWLYKKRKKLPPHVLTGRTQRSTHINVIGDRLLFFIPSSATSRTKITKSGNVHFYNFGPIHERRKSILKAAVVFAWNDIRRRISMVYQNGILTNGGNLII